MYEFASGVINVLEKKVFDEKDQERMLKAPGREAAFEVLFDTDLADNAAEEKNIERIIERDVADFKSTLSNILKQEPTVFWLLFLRFDALNLKIALKKALNPERALGIEPFPYGLVPFDKLVQKLNGQRIDLNPLVEKMIASAIKAAAAGLNSKEIETIVDEAYFEVKLSASSVLEPFLTEVTRMEIDVANVKSLLKARPAPTAEGANFIKGGNLKLEELQKLVTLKEGEIFQDLKKFFEVFGLSLLIEKYAKEGSETILENKLQGFLSEKVFEKAREASCGISKILAFFHKKINSYANIRLIMFSKENNIPPAEIEPLLLPV